MLAKAPDKRINFVFILSLNMPRGKERKRTRALNPLTIIPIKKGVAPRFVAYRGIKGKRILCLKKNKK